MAAHDDALKPPDPIFDCGLMRHTLAISSGVQGDLNWKKAMCLVRFISCGNVAAGFHRRSFPTVAEMHHRRSAHAQVSVG